MSDISTLKRWIGALADRPAAEHLWAARRMGAPALRTLCETWEIWARDGQLPPPGAWRLWLMMTGRGYGKTRAGAELVSELARANGSLRIALVGATPAEVERVMIRGKSGLMAVARTEEDLIYYPSRGLVEFASGAQAFVYSGANPDGLRGPEHHFAWCDELAKWAYPEAAFDNLMLGLRLGRSARALITTTPRPIALLRRLIGRSDIEKTGGRTEDNDALEQEFLDDVRGRYAGTRLERQELDGELIEDVAGALWAREVVTKCRAHAPEALARVVVGVDPPASAGGDSCGIIVCGLGADGIGYVLDDLSAGGLSPEGWARAVVRAAEKWEAERVVVETNQGGEMVESVLRSIDSALPVRPVRARYGKGRRAEPVSALFAQGKAMFAGVFPELEDELCGMTAAGYEGPGRSPDRADAMVWAMAELLLGKDRIPRIRRL
jgi:phage terminase large subunit-like protein